MCSRYKVISKGHEPETMHTVISPLLYTCDCGMRAASYMDAADNRPASVWQLPSCRPQLTQIRFFFSPPLHPQYHIQCWDSRHSTLLHVHPSTTAHTVIMLLRFSSHTSTAPYPPTCRLTSLHSQLQYIQKIQCSYSKSCITWESKATNSVIFERDCFVSSLFVLIYWGDI